MLNREREREGETRKGLGESEMLRREGREGGGSGNRLENGKVNAVSFFEHMRLGGWHEGSGEVAYTGSLNKAGPFQFMRKALES